jgi:hypothetical protein
VSSLAWLQDACVIRHLEGTKAIVGFQNPGRHVADSIRKAKSLAIANLRATRMSNLVGPWLFLLHPNHSELGGRDYLLGRRKLFALCTSSKSRDPREYPGGRDFFGGDRE